MPQHRLQDTVQQTDDDDDDDDDSHNYSSSTLFFHSSSYKAGMHICYNLGYTAPLPDFK